MYIIPDNVGALLPTSYPTDPADAYPMTAMIYQLKGSDFAANTGLASTCTVIPSALATASYASAYQTVGFSVSIFSPTSALNMGGSVEVCYIDDTS
jgi:hypothetical protein